ncbi:hypothetical protein AWH62_10330 [Maricaulis sp. W15]|uniref:hypothetical protein n=1 Tax=Maricaulis sp. W15 TaxID=1772333 RepID=UPI000948C6D8|nr:hypothetical protein [Maricaulis sp. W15]OLF72232.1 hypothetical protein AWH62_10330 [Maricaulis sp. W15]
MPTALKRLFGRNPWRAIGAWLLTCYLVSVVGIAGFAILAVLDAGNDAGRQNYWVTVTMAPVWGLFGGVVTAVFSALPVWGLVSLFRGLKWLRPLSELIAGALLSLVLLQLLVGTLTFGAAEGPSPFPFWLYLVFLAFGAAAGWCYWRLAGRPGRPTDEAADAVKARVFD